MDKKTVIQIITIVLLIAILVVLGIFTFKEMTNRNGFVKDFGNGIFNGQMMNEDVEKDVKKEDVAKGEKTNKKNIELSMYNSNVTLTEKGEYTVSGSFEHTLIVDSNEAVTVILNNVNITNNAMAAIANIGKGTLTIKLKDGTVNNLTDGGSSEYDACIYSEAPLVIEGNGTLNVYGKQLEGEGIATETNDITINGGTINIECEDDGLNAGGDGGVITINGGVITIKAKGDGIDSNKDLIINGGTVYTMGSSVGGDAGIDTDGKFEINGGSVIALGSDMLQKPDNSSKQKSVSLTLTLKISFGKNVVVKDSSGKEVANFEAKETFKTLTVSNKNITTGKYNVYVDGKIVGTSTVK